MATGLVIMTVITFANVISRYILHASWSFTEEITTNIFVLCSLLGAAVAARDGAHLGLSALTDFIPKKYQKFVILITVICAIIFCYFLIRYGISMVASQMEAKQQTPALGWPEWVFGLSIPVGGFAILVRYIQVGIKAFKKEEAK
jgi:C4-dicarboxylate transporter DctQ subunit